MEYLKNETQLNEEKSSIVVELIKKACEAVHITKAAQVKAQKAYEAIQTNDKNILWRTLQEYLAKYKDFINSLSNFTRVEVFEVGPQFFDNCSIEQIKKQLKTVVAFVYLKEALTNVAKESFKQCLKKSLKATGVFTDAELAFW